tara:strand:+ start:461 stop:589 length:129 start_codon:yes stop_codon:yes gene_type:complete
MVATDGAGGGEPTLLLGDDKTLFNFTFVTLVVFFALLLELAV